MGVVGESFSWPFLPIVFTNELAKFLRSLVLPALFIAGYQAWNLMRPLAALLIGCVAAFVFLLLPKTRSKKKEIFRLALLLSMATAFGSWALMLFRTGASRPLLFLVVSVASLFGYLVLKNLHVLLVYWAAGKVKDAEGNDGKYGVSTVTDGGNREVRLVFWDGKLVGSAMAPTAQKRA